MLDNFPQWWVAFYNAVKASVTPKQEAFEVKVLRPHQLEAVEACMAIYNDPLDSFKSGKVILPTGTGKTLIESENIRRVILIQQQAGKLPVIKVNSSRILLCGQLCKDIFEYLQSHGVEARYVIFNSGTSDEKWFVTKMKELGGTWRKIICTTDPHEVMDAFQKATTENIPLIIVSTYDSSVKFAESMLCPCLTIHDEAHNLVSGETCKAADRTICPTEASFFFTATEKTTESNEDLGMNNLVRFGKTIYTKAPKEMIEKGEMVPPRTHIVSPKNGIAYDLAKIDNDIEALCISIWDAYAEHEKKIKESSCSPDSIGAKILIVCRGQKELKDMMDPEAEAAAEEGIKTTKKVFKNSVFDTLRKAHPGVHLFALSSDYGIYNDGEFLPSPVSNAKKYALMQKIEALESEESALIFHVDMISEGIDVPGITGVMPFRNCEFAKFMQNVGRSARLHNEDRSNVYAGEIQSNEQDRESKKWVKPFCWVIIPSFLENSSGFEDRYKMIIKDLRENYNFSPCQPTHIDNNEDNGLNDDPDVITVNDKNKKSPHSKSGLEEFEHKFEGMSVCARVEAMAANSDEKDDFLDQLITLGNTCPTRTIVPIVDAVLPPTERSTPRLAKGSVKPQKRPIDLTADLTGIIYRMDERGIVATGKIVNGKFIILPGSGFRYEANPSMPVGYGEIRNRMIQEGIVVNGIVVREFEVSSGSTAAGVLLGASANGNACWNRI
jgi:superfamily II DNA or RNA helicase